MVMDRVDSFEKLFPILQLHPHTGQGDRLAGILKFRELFSHLILRELSPLAGSI